MEEGNGDEIRNILEVSSNYQESRHNYLNKLKYLGAALVFYAAFSFITLFTTYDIKSKIEEYNPRIRQERNIIGKKADKDFENVAQHVYDFSMFPWKRTGLATHERYLETRLKSLDLAGIDEMNSTHDANRFSLYRNLGFAVRQSDRLEQGIYIPFSAWRDYLRKNSGMDIKDLDKLTEMLGDKKNYSILLGRAFFKADSKKEGGNEDGVADNFEWGQALRQMSYYTLEDIVSKVIGSVKSNPPDLRMTLVNFISGIPERSRKGMIVEKIDDIKTIPIDVLNSYLDSSQGVISQE